jgi:hypothetical protein
LYAHLRVEISVRVAMKIARAWDAPLASFFALANKTSHMAQQAIVRDINSIDFIAYHNGVCVLRDIILR